MICFEEQTWRHTHAAVDAHLIVVMILAWGTPYRLVQEKKKKSPPSMPFAISSP